MPQVQESFCSFEFLCTQENGREIPGDEVKADRENTLVHSETLRKNSYKKSYKNLQDSLKNYFKFHH
jgi:hypothetical protein